MPPAQSSNLEYELLAKDSNSPPLARGRFAPFLRPWEPPSSLFFLLRGELGHEEVETDLRLVLIWPTWPQFAHLRAVPSLLRPFAFCGVFSVPLGADAGPSTSEGPGEPAAGELAAFFAALVFSRATRRSLLRWIRASSLRS